MKLRGSPSNKVVMQEAANGAAPHTPSAVIADPNAKNREHKDVQENREADNDKGCRQ